MTTLLPSIPTMEDVGSVFLKEFSFTDGCDKSRTHPLVIIEKPKRIMIPNHDCTTPQLMYNEWSTSAQLFRDSPNHYGCLDHVISIRISLSSGSDVQIIRDNVSSLLSQFSSSSGPYTLTPP